ncbi:family 43 glycosylhydrolase [Nocardioides marmoribigeumensis]|uniref:Arabinan endo-1,5-alpha-L-arabinosidase n=1 Tax=Nocardioides marmoribigeumensis TaxID=433649 RepID=A0ABU2BSI2_9ACTN|nr:family 43 glycosylhydrolase [Nocardioides marmoribigeumensis]MDR7361593.1 arabinan endo-1,5-alpha-L-arabinosidase [Nocardioides marmoribigeumensis]
MPRVLMCLLVPLVLASAGLAVRAERVEAAAVTQPGSYTNPLRPTTSSGATVQSCADPSVQRGRGASAGTWFMWCTSDPLNDAETTGRMVFHLLPTMRSTDLVHWRYVGPALSAKPAWAGSTAKLWAPDVVYSRTYDRWYLLFAVTDTRSSVSGEPRCEVDPAIGVAVARRPTGPWAVAPRPLVPPRRTGPGCSFASTIDPDVLGSTIGSGSTLYFGGFRGGILGQSVRVSATGMWRTGSAVRLASAPRYEGANVVKRGDWYYLTVSSGQCCNGAMSGYGVFSGRAARPLGPFVDRDGVPLLGSRSGGTPLLVMNGNTWVGPGHSSMFRDRGGQWWVAYHAIDESDPYFATRTGFTRRPPMLDPVDWRDGWPVVRAGRGASVSRMRAPAAKPGQRTAYRPVAPVPDRPGSPVAAASDELGGDHLDDRWTWVRRPDPSAYSVSGGALHLPTAPGRLDGSADAAPVPTLPAPPGDFVAETSVRLDVPATGEGYDGAQAGLVLYGSDRRYVKLVHVALGGTRQTVLGRQVPTGPAGWPRYGTSTAGPPGQVTRLRLVRRTVGTRVTYRAWTRSDDEGWVRGPAWTHAGLGRARLGLVAMGQAGHQADFGYLRVWTLGS